MESIQSDERDQLHRVTSDDLPPNSLNYETFHEIREWRQADYPQPPAQVDERLQDAVSIEKE